jgi:hypothetical protein
MRRKHFAPPYFIDVTAPVLGATEVVGDGHLLWRVWCKHCERLHYHGPAEGHLGEPQWRAGKKL